MSARKSQRQDEERLAKAVSCLNKAQEDRDRILRDTARTGTISRRRAGEISGLTRSRVQQIINAPWSHRVRFVGYLSHGAEKALGDAGLELRLSRGGGSVAPGGELPRPDKHTIYLEAEGSGEAQTRVEHALRGFGEFFNFKAEPVSPS